jgi:hypothetical protein
MSRLPAPAALAVCLAVAAPTAAQTNPPSPPAPAPAAPTPAPATQPTPDAPPAPAPAPEVPATTETPGALTSPTPVPPAVANQPVAPKKDAITRPPTEPDPWVDGHALGVEASLRGGSRIGSTSFITDTEERAGLGFDLAAWFRLAPEYAFGLALKRFDLGSVGYTEGQSSINADYATTALELGGRAFPLHGKDGELFIGLHVGLAWQDVDATGLRPSVNLQPSVPYSCSDVAGPGFALGAEVGGALRLTQSFWLTGGVGADGYHLTSDAVGDCVGGIGTVTAVSLGAGLLYAFDLGRETKLSASNRPF